MRKKFIKIISLVVSLGMMCGSIFATSPTQITPSHQAPSVPPATPDAEQHITPSQAPPTTSPSPNATTPSTTTPRPGTTIQPSTSPSPSTTTPQSIAPRPGSTTNPSTTDAPNQSRQTKPFTLDNFKVIENTLKCFGVDSRELAQYIKQGKKLEEVLKEERISVKKFKKQILREYYKTIDEAIMNKQLTQKQSTQLKKAIKDTVKGWLPRK